jgi:hypothetical protein
LLGARLALNEGSRPVLVLMVAIFTDASRMVTLGVGLAEAARVH